MRKPSGTRFSWRLQVLAGIVAAVLILSGFTRAAEPAPHDFLPGEGPGELERKAVRAGARGDFASAQKFWGQHLLGLLRECAALKKRTGDLAGQSRARLLRAEAEVVAGWIAEASEYSTQHALALDLLLKARKRAPRGMLPACSRG